MTAPSPIVTPGMITAFCPIQLPAPMETGAIPVMPWSRTAAVPDVWCVWSQMKTPEAISTLFPIWTDRTAEIVALPEIETRSPIFSGTCSSRRCDSKSGSVPPCIQQPDPMYTPCPTRTYSTPASRTGAKMTLFFPNSANDDFTRIVLARAVALTNKSYNAKLKYFSPKKVSLICISYREPVLWGILPEI